MQTRFTRRTRLLSWLLTLAMLLSIAPVSAFAEGSDTSITPVAIDDTNFPDENFRNYVQKAFDGDNDQFLSQSEIAAVTEIKCASKKISDLTGIEHFTSLTKLYCVDNQLTSLDVSQNSALNTLYCYDNQLTSLDVSQNSALETLYCDNNQLTSLDVSQNSVLEELHCTNNQLTSLNLDGADTLTKLYCSVNQLTSLDVSQNSALNTLSCYGNRLASLKLSGADALTKLYCYDNQLTSLDVSQNGALDTLYCYGNQLTSLDVSQNSALDTLYCYENQLAFLKLSGADALKKLSCSYNQLTSLDVSQNSALEMLDCDENNLTELNLNGIDALKGLECNGNQLASLDVRQNPALTYLSVSANALTELDVRQNPALTYLSVRANALTELDVRQNPALMYLSVSANALTELDVSKNSVLDTLYCYDNQLTSLDVSQNKDLMELYCDNNALTALDVRQNTALTTLGCSGNQLTSLDLSQNPDLEADYYSNDGNLYSIQLNTDNTFDLSTLPGKFDVSRASNWQGGSVSGNTLTVNPGVTTVTYTYQCSDTISSDFTLDISGSAPAPTSYTAYWVAHEGDQPIASVQVPGAIGDAEEKVRFVGWYTADGTRLEDTPYFTTENGGPHIEVDKLTQDVTFYARWCTESELQTLNFADCTVTINPEMTVFGRRDDLTSPAKVAPGARVVLTMDKSKADEGMKFAITPAPADWNDNGTTATFTMPEQEVTVKVGTSVTPDPDNPDNPDQPGPDTPAQQHTLTFEDCTVEVTSASSGASTTYTASPIQVAKGDRVTLKLDETKIPEGMKFNGFVIDPIPAPDEMTTDGTTVTFTMPDENTTVRVNFCTESEDSSLDFGTVVAGTAVAGAVGFVAYQVGTEVILDQLLPEGVAVPKTRAELVLLLWKNAGSPAPAAAPAFVDVEDPALANAAQWALEQGYLNAREDGSFAPEKRVAKWRVIKAWKAASRSTTAQ